MILPDFKAFPRVGRMMGIDGGLARIGLAVSDPSRYFVFVNLLKLREYSEVLNTVPQMVKTNWELVLAHWERWTESRLKH